MFNLLHNLHKHYSTPSIAFCPCIDTLPPTSQITLLDVYQAIDPDMYLVDCMDPGKPCSRNGAGGRPCQVHRKLASIQKKLWDLLSEESLENILNHEQ